MALQRAFPEAGGGSGGAIGSPSDVGLGNVNNTSDANKPVSTAQQAALNLKQDILAEGAFVDGDKTKLNSIEANATYNNPDSALLNRENHFGTQEASTITGLTSSSVGLDNVDNTSDANKPVSTAQQAALNLKATTNPAGITGASAISNIVIISQANYDAIVTKNATTLYIIQD